MVQLWVLVLGLMTVFGLSDRGVAQVVPDQTLPVGERSQVSGDSNTQINGGAIRGNNLFHSFQQFSIPTGGSASFNNSANITNIFTRVTGTNSSSQAGEITIQAVENVTLQDSVIDNSIASGGIGKGGDIMINARSLFLTDGARVSTRTLGEGAANAFSGRGGNIRITTQGLFGIAPRSIATTGLSSITASSQFGISGTIVLNTPDVDPSRGLVQLPTELQDTSGLIATTCPADKGNSFAITGRGGLPEDPRQPLMGDGVWLDDRASAQPSILNPQPMSTIAPQASKRIVEAQGWTRDRNGTITLVATRTGGMTQASQSSLCALLTGNH